MIEELEQTMRLEERISNLKAAHLGLQEIRKKRLTAAIFILLTGGLSTLVIHHIHLVRFPYFFHFTGLVFFVGSIILFVADRRSLEELAIIQRTIYEMENLEQEILDSLEQKPTKDI